MLDPPQGGSGRRAGGLDRLARQTPPLIVPNNKVSGRRGSEGHVGVTRLGQIPARQNEVAMGVLIAVLPCCPRGR